MMATGRLVGTITALALVAFLTVWITLQSMMTQPRHQRRRRRQRQRRHQHQCRHQFSSFLPVSMANIVVAVTSASDTCHCRPAQWHSATAPAGSASTVCTTVVKQHKAVCATSAALSLISSHSIRLMPIDATATATAATAAVSASASSMTMSHGSVTKQTMVRILTLSSLLCKWDYESQTTCAAETSLIVATLRTQPTSALIRCLVGTDRPVQRKLTCGCANRSGNMSILGSAAKRRHRESTDSS